MKTTGLIFFIMVMCGIGIICLFFTNVVVGIAVKSVSQGLTHNSTIESFIRSNKYWYVVKAVGFGATLMACFLAWVFFRNIQ
jgi:hypothetical protein